MFIDTNQKPIGEAKRRIQLHLPDSFEWVEDAVRPVPSHVRLTLTNGEFSGEVSGQAIPDGPSTRLNVWNKFAEYSLLYLAQLPSYCDATPTVEGTEGIAHAVTLVRFSGACGSMRVAYDNASLRVRRLTFPIRVSTAPRDVGPTEAAQITVHPGYDEGTVVVTDYRLVDGLYIPYRTERIVDVRREVMTVVASRVIPSS